MSDHPILCYRFVGDFRYAHSTTISIKVHLIELVSLQLELFSAVLHLSRLKIVQYKDSNLPFSGMEYCWKWIPIHKFEPNLKTIDFTV